MRMDWGHIAPIEHGPTGPDFRSGEMTMRLLIPALSLAAFLFSADAALADKRVAFVVGNGA
jgi:hypothetical protein